LSRLCNGCSISCARKWTPTFMHAPARTCKHLQSRCENLRTTIWTSNLEQGRSRPNGC
jgi:hypothetical protein